MIGDIESESSRPEEALDAFNRLLDDFPESYLSDLALKKKAEVYENLLHNPREAQLLYEQLLTTFPKSIYVEEVRRKIRVLEGIS